MYSNWQQSLAATHLLPLFRDCHHALSMTLADWDDTVRLARQARLLGLIAGRLKENRQIWEQIPERVHGHLRSSINFSAHRQQMVRMELRALDKVLPPKITVVLLKGAAYIVQQQEFAKGRMPNDVDLLVKRSDLNEAEATLNAAGWVSETTSNYDQHYYREWSHELPPMRYPGHALEVDQDQRQQVFVRLASAAHGAGEVTRYRSRTSWPTQPKNAVASGDLSCSRSSSPCSAATCGRRAT